MQNLPPITGNYYDADGNTFNLVDILTGDTSVRTLVNGKPQGTVFGVDMVVGQEKVAISGKWDMGLQLDGLIREFIGTGYLKITDGEETIELGTGTDADGESKVYSLNRVRYEPGAPLFMDYTVAWPKLEDSNGDYTMGVGFYDGVDGFVQGHRRRTDALEYGFILYRGGVETWFPANGPIMPLNYNNLNIHRLDGGYLGVAPTNLYVRNTLEELFLRLHRQTYEQRTTNVKTPDLPVGAFVRNEGNTNNVVLLNGSFKAGTINGGQKEDPSAVVNTYDRTFAAGAGIDQTIFAFRNDMEVDMYTYVDINETPTTSLLKNTIAAQLKQVKLAVLDNNKNVVIDLYVTSIDDITSGTFTPVDLGRSVLKVSEDAVVDLTNALKLETFLLGKDAQNPDSEIKEVDLLFPGQVAIFVYTTLSVNFDFNTFIKYKDRY